MISNLFLTAWRNMRRHFSYTLLNILGLTLGIATSIIIFLVVRNELSYESPLITGKPDYVEPELLDASNSDETRRGGPAAAPLSLLPRPQPSTDPP